MKPEKPFDVRREITITVMITAVCVLIGMAVGSLIKARWGEVWTGSVKVGNARETDHMGQKLGTNVSKVRRVDEPPPVVPDGKYHGFWTGSAVRWMTPKGVFIGEVEHGIRGIDIPCVVTVQDGVIVAKAESGEAS